MKVTVVACDFDGGSQPSLLEESSPLKGFQRPATDFREVISPGVAENSPLLKDMLGEKIKPFENLEDQPAFLRKRKRE